MIKVAQIIENMNMGGIENLVMEIYRHIDRTRVQFDFITSEASKNVPDEEITKLGGKVYRVPSYRHLLKYSRSLKKIFEKEKYDIVQANLNTMCPFALYAAKQVGTSVRIAQNLSMAHWQEKKSLVKLLLRPFGKCFATHLMCNGEACGRWLFGDADYDAGKVALFKTLINTKKNEYNPELREKTRQQYGLKDEIVLGHIARLVPQKNSLFVIEIAAEAYRKNNKVRLLLVGDGVLKEEVMRKIKQLEMEDMVVYLGFQDNIVPLYQAMDVFLLPSLYEGLPIVGLEAQASGIPTFFSTEITNEIGITNLAHFLPLQLPAERWAMKILNAVQNNTDRKSHSDEIRRAGFDSSEESERLLQYYQNALNGKIK